MSDATAIEAPLLDAGSSLASPRTRTGSRTKSVLIGSLFVGLAGVVGFVAGQFSADDSEAHNVGAALGELVQVGDAATTLAVVPYTATCYGYTGGTCVVDACNPNRSATCVQAKCVCLDGCTGVDGKCYPQEYKSVNAKPFTLSNVYWSRYQLYVQSASLFSQLKVSAMWAATFMGTNEFNLYQLPGLADGKKNYFLASAKWPSWVVSIATTTLTAFSPFAVYAYNLYHTVAPWDPSGLVVTVCSMKKMGYDNAVMIGTSGLLGKHFMYIHEGSWLVYATAMSEDPGQGGYWTPNPPLEGLDDC